jgi:hypothetical protein
MDKLVDYIIKKFKIHITFYSKLFIVTKHIGLTNEISKLNVKSFFMKP